MAGEETTEREGTRCRGGNIIEKGKFLERQKRLGPGLKGKVLLFHCNRKGMVQTQFQSQIRSQEVEGALLGWLLLFSVK